MKKKLFCFPLILLTPVLFGCGGSKTALTYGLISTETKAINLFKELTYDELKEKVTDDKENFLLVTYLGKESTCSCWAIFKGVVKNYNAKYHGLFYLIPVKEFAGKDNLGMTIPQNDTNSLSIFSEGKLLKQWVKTGSNNVEMFENDEKLRNEITKYVTDPSVFYVDETSLDNKIKEKASLNVYFKRSGCSDCSAMDKHMFIPYYKANQFKDELYIFDLLPYMSDPKAYQEIEDKYGLSVKNNPSLGYDNGYVPTLQHIENQQIKDMIVIYNDKVEKKDNNFVITRSYFDGIKTHQYWYIKILDRVLDPSEVLEAEKEGVTFYIWNKEKAAQVYKPMFDSFMDLYIKK